MNRFVALMFSLFAFVLPGHAGALDPYPVTEADKKFLAEIVNAVQKQDTVWIADHMMYPLSIVVSNQTRIVNTKEEFRPILGQELSHEIRTKIVHDAKQPLFKNWKGLMVGDGIVWFTEYGKSENGPWYYVIDAMGYFAWQASEPVITSSSGH
jgi:hypothetical protein